MDKKKRIVIALGDNALGNTLPEQVIAIKITAKAIVDSIEEGCEIIVVHGNGLQVGMINSTMAALSREGASQPNTPFSVRATMSQVHIGYDLQNASREELLNRNIDNIPVATMITQIRVDENDPALQASSKPTGHFMTAEQAKEAEEKYGYTMRENSGRGYHRVVASPEPTQIIEIDAICSLVDSGQLVIACGGGGVPVTLKSSHLKGINAVIDKDFVSELLAEELGADFLITFTAVEKAAINHGKPGVKWLSDITTDGARRYTEEGHFALDSTLPKVQTAVKSVDSKGGRTPPTILLEKAKKGIQGLTGTKTHQ